MKQNGITLAAIEVNFLFPEVVDYVTLKHLAVQSDGFYGQIKSTSGDDVNEQMQPVLDFVTSRLQEDSPDIQDEYEIVSHLGLSFQCVLLRKLTAFFLVFQGNVVFVLSPKVSSNTEADRL